MGRGARDKFVPDVVFRAPRTEIATFLNRLFATDGWISTLSTGQAQAGYASISERLVRQVQHLLLRFGVIASVRRREVTYRGERREAWQLDITDAASITALAGEIGIFGKEEKVERALAAHSQQWADLADSDVYWDRITEVRPAGEDLVYDLTIPDTHNFVANDISVHNSSFSTNVAQSLALKHSRSVGIFSLEMSVQEIAMRILASEAEVPLRKRRPSDRDWDRIHRAARRIAEARIFIDDSASPTLLEVSSKSRRLKLERGLDLLIVDYLQLMQAGGRYENRNLEIGAITRGLKGLAKELSIPVIALSQLSRQPERRGSDHRPQLADLRESGSIEQDADLVAFIYRDEIYNPDNEESQGLAELIVAKNRNGQTGTVDLAFFGETTTFRSLSRQAPPPL
jgi:replicative DNA helicase